MTWRGELEHADLLSSAMALAEELKLLHDRLAIGEVHHYIHTEFAERARQLGFQLDGALALVRGDLYGPAFGLLRTALEQVLVDSLIFRGTRYYQLAQGVSEERWADWERQRAEGAEWTRDISSWSWNPKGNVHIHREGIRVSGSPGQTISIFYYLLNEYSPLAGPPDHQGRFEDGLVSLEVRVAQAEKHREWHRRYLGWPAIKENLVVNGLATAREVERFDVHYRFLSAFVHPTANVVGSLYPRNEPWPVYDHYSSELALLYVNAFAARELADFALMASREPTIELSGWTEVESLVRASESRASHLWLFDSGPTGYDRFRVANERSFARADRSEAPTRPDDLTDAEVSYYPDPLRRLIAMHRSTLEISTGSLYDSPWERVDARDR